jgi:hypothetical protein
MVELLIPMRQAAMVEIVLSQGLDRVGPMSLPWVVAEAEGFKLRQE